MSDTHTLDEAILDTELRYINYFNGRLLSAEDLSQEQTVNRARARHLGRALGAGVAFGLEVSMSGSDATQGLVEVAAGLAVNAAGQTLHLECNQIVALVGQPDPSQVSECLFADCPPKAAGTTASAQGYYVLTIAPAAKRAGLAPVSGLGSRLAACNSKYYSEGVKFRFLRLPTSASGATARNTIAYECLGHPNVNTILTTALGGGSETEYGLATLVARGDLTEEDVPLAIVEWKASSALGFVDLWSVRRRIIKPAASKVWGHFTDDRRRSEAEATLLQFQDHAAAILQEPGVAPALKAEARFRFLPPAGFLKVDGTNFAWKSFLGAHAPRNETPLDEGLVRSVVWHSLGQEPVRVIAAANALATPPVPFHVYRVPSRTDYVLFARSSLGEVLAEDVRFDNSRCKLPGVETVQDAIEALCDACRGCCTLVAHPEPGWEKIFDKIAPGQDAEVCFQAGTFALSKPFVIQGKGHLRIVGCGRATRIVCSGGESALQFVRCASVSISHLRAESGLIAPGKPAGQHLGGALNFVNCLVVEVAQAVLSCPSGARRMAACLTVLNDAKAPGNVRVQGCECEVGQEQVGILLINTARAHVEDNLLRSRALTGSQGIVFGGRVAADIRVLHNTLKDFMQGVHVGLSHPDPKRLEKPDAAGSVLIVGNTVDVRLMASSTRGRHGIFVGSCESLVIGQNRLSLTRDNKARARLIEGIRIFGWFGKRLSVRENHLSPVAGSPSFNVGVLFHPLNVPVKSGQIWFFGENVFESSPTRFSTQLSSQQQQFLRGLDTNIA